MVSFDDGETLEPRAQHAKKLVVPSLRLVYDGGTSRAAARLHLLTRGSLSLGRSVEGPADIRVDDPRVSRVHTRIDVENGRVRLVNESKYGTRVNGAPVDDVMLNDRDVIALGDSLFVFRTAPSVDGSAMVRAAFAGISHEAATVRAEIALAARGATSVLIVGPTGSGKEVVAQAIHDAAHRAGPFVAVNASAIPDSLAESQLFGHRSGAFTGAKNDHVGFFVEAQNGTLLLDEIGDLATSIQPKLLRALEERKVRPVGAQKDVDVDVLVIGATHKDLSALVESGAFRADLYARLTELVISIPPLADRREDILLLAEQRLDDGDARIAPALAERLLVYPWPFNVRELQKVMAEARARGEGRESLDLALVEARLSLVPRAPLPLQSSTTVPLMAPAGERSANATDESLENALLVPIPDRAALEALLERHRGVVADIARETGRSRKQVYRWLTDHGLDVERYRAP
jgi:DNA-binding NtrC family response regulator